MRRAIRNLLCLLALTTNSAAVARLANVPLSPAGTPPGFSELESPRVTLVDVYFGDRKVGEGSATTRPGFLRFRSPTELIAKLPQVIAAPELTSALGADLPTNSQAVCSASNMTNCGVLSPEIVGIIYDEDHFRVDLFFNPRFLKTAHANTQGYLPASDAPLSLTNALGFTASGAVGGPSVYNIQNRTIIGLKNARLRANTSMASRLGFVADDFVGELDSRNLRYSAGLFWSPGNDFVGQRRLIGAGFGTQFDTWADQESLRGTPLILFLPQPSRVELLVDGRLVSSRTYSAGNNQLDTSGLAAGSYSVVLRIHQSNGVVREDRRFFVKNAQVPPAGHPIFYAYAGLLANTALHRPISLSKTFYYQGGTAWRLTNNIALDLAILGTRRKAIMEAGGWFIKGPVRLRAAALASTAGDLGGLLQLSTTGHGPLNVSFDLRRIWSYDGRPLVPLPSYAGSFDVAPPTGVQLATGSYMQAIGSIGLRVGDGYLSLIGSYRKDRSFEAEYAVGPSINLPVLSHNGVQFVLEASAQRTRTTTVGFVGARMLFSSGPLSLLSSIGRSFQGERAGGPAISRVVTNMTAQYSHQTENDTLITAEGGLDRNIASSTMHAGGAVYSKLGNLRADVLRNLKGPGGTQYDVAFQSGMAAGARSATWGARDVEQSAVIVSLGGNASNAVFDVLVNEVPKGHIKVGQRLPLFLPPYRTYKIRMVPTAAAAVSYDASERSVTLYPGNVHPLAWQAETFFTLFAQAVSSEGKPIADAVVQSTKAIGQTDNNGFFQIDVRRGDPISIARSNAPPCHLALGRLIVRNDFVSLGKVVCE